MFCKLRLAIRSRWIICESRGVCGLEGLLMEEQSRGDGMRFGGDVR